MYGVKMERRSTIANRNEYRGFGLFSPWIFEPSQRRSVGQNTSIIRGVPEPAKNRNGVERITKNDAMSDTLFLNQRLRRSTNKKPRSRPIRMLGSLIAYGVSPKIITEIFWSTRYGKSTRSPFSGASMLRATELVVDSISASDKPY
jgi:hypothetical protein